MVCCVCATLVRCIEGPASLISAFQRDPISAALNPARCSFRTPLIGSSVNLQRRISVSFAGEQTNLKVPTFQGSRSVPHPPDPLTSRILLAAGLAENCPGAVDHQRTQV